MVEAGGADGSPREEPLLLSRRSADPPHDAATAAPLRLALTAEERTRVRGLRHSRCGRSLLLQLPRGEALRPGEWLAPEHGGPFVQVEAAAEPLLLVRAATPLALLQAAYHLGNRHVAMELHADRLLLLDDSVLADLLRRRGLQVECLEAPFCPEPGAYEEHGHAHSHGSGHHHDH